jgi:imidazolonepropionase
MNDFVLMGAGPIMTCDPARPGLGLIEDGAVVVRDGRIAWVGTRSLPEAFRPLPTMSAGGGLVTPGLCDAHAHPIFAGDRSAEFALRAAGASYLDIAAAGGGIAASVSATLAASDEALVAGTLERLGRALAAGTTTLEAKTGYALDLDAELHLLDLLVAVGSRQPVTLCPTLLAHVIPKDRDRAAFVDAWVRGVGRAAGRARAVDIYCDEGAFTLDEARAILGAARAAGLAVRAHAGQFADLGAAGLVAELGGLSADHLEHVSEEQAQAMARAGVACTLLPGACVQLRCPVPPVERLRRAGCDFALGTDMNPGSSLTESLPLQMWLACTHLGLTVEEAWLAVTRVGARAAGRPEAGQIVPGAPADLVIWTVADHRTVPYHYGVNLVRGVIVGGRMTRRFSGDALA